MATMRTRLERLEQTAQRGKKKLIVVKVDADAPDFDEEIVDWASYGVNWNDDNLVVRILSFCGLGSPPKVISVLDI